MTVCWSPIIDCVVCIECVVRKGRGRGRRIGRNLQFLHFTAQCTPTEGCIQVGYGAVRTVRNPVHDLAPRAIFGAKGNESATQVVLAAPAQTQAFKILVKDPSVKGVFINIFGGILRCDVLAEGVIAASKELEIRLPVVVRLEGTDKERGREMLTTSGIRFMAVDSLKEAVERIAKEMGPGGKGVEYLGR